MITDLIAINRNRIAARIGCQFTTDMRDEISRCDISKGKGKTRFFGGHRDGNTGSGTLIRGGRNGIAVDLIGTASGNDKPHPSAHRAQDIAQASGGAKGDVFARLQRQNDVLCLCQHILAEHIGMDALTCRRDRPEIAIGNHDGVFGNRLHFNRARQPVNFEQFRYGGCGFAVNIPRETNAAYGQKQFLAVGIKEGEVGLARMTTFGTYNDIAAKRGVQRDFVNADGERAIILGRQNHAACNISHGRMNDPVAQVGMILRFQFQMRDRRGFVRAVMHGHPAIPAVADRNRADLGGMGQNMGLQGAFCPHMIK